MFNSMIIFTRKMLNIAAVGRLSPQECLFWQFTEGHIKTILYNDMKITDQVTTEALSQLLLESAECRQGLQYM